MKDLIRELMHATPFRPFVIRMADSREHRVEHPDFVFPLPDEVAIVIVYEAGHIRHLSHPMIAAVDLIQVA